MGMTCQHIQNFCRCLVGREYTAMHDCPSFGNIQYRSLKYRQLCCLSRLIQIIVLDRFTACGVESQLNNKINWSKATFFIDKGFFSIYWMPLMIFPVIALVIYWLFFWTNNYTFAVIQILSVPWGSLVNKWQKWTDWLVNQQLYEPEGFCLEFINLGLGRGW